MASSGYGIPNYETVSDVDINQLLEQFEEENMLSLRLGSHRAGAGDFDAFADVSELTPSYLQDEDGGLDKDLAARLAALKAPQNGNARTDRGKSAASADRTLTKTSDKEEDRKNSSLEGKPSQDLAKPTEGKESGSELGPKERERLDGRTGTPVVRAADKRAEPDPDDVASLGSDLASRLRKLKGGAAPVGANQRELPDVDVSKGNALEAERYASLQKRRANRAATDGAAAMEERTAEQAAPTSVEVAGPSGMAFIDISRGGAKKQVAEVGASGGRARESWRNPLAGLFDQRRSSSAKSGTAPDLLAGPADGPSDVDNTERRARELLAGFSKGVEGAGGSSRKSAGRQGLAPASMNPNSALFQDLQAVRVPRAEGAYDQVVKEEQKEQSEVEALLAAMHDDVRIKRERRALGLEMAEGEHLSGSQGEEEDGSVDSDSELSEGPKQKKVDEIAAWAVDAARLEVVGADTKGGAPVVKSRHNHKSISSDEDESVSDYESSNDSDGPGLKGRKSASRKGSRR